MEHHRTSSLKETNRLAAAFARRLEAGSVVALIGDLGTGKTAFVRGVASALGVTEPVTSPTYTIIAEYPGNPPLVHMDLYRLTDASEFELLGVEEYLEGDSITLIEWADRAMESLPDERTIIVEIRFAEGNRREFTIRGPEG
ncbi:MAG: tRNA (adenosine(37)-N6)-threonylcarbamoyltransferase complex ATPase subunit type 1 TsaE [Alkalispirochaetaceae bacterium]